MRRETFKTALDGGKKKRNTLMLANIEMDKLDREDYLERNFNDLLKGRQGITRDRSEALSLLTRQRIKTDSKIIGVDKITFKSILTLVGGLILMMTSGLAYALGTISPYIVSYFRINLRYDVNYDTFYPL